MKSRFLGRLGLLGRSFMASLLLAMGGLFSYTLPTPHIPPALLSIEESKAKVLDPFEEKIADLPVFYFRPQLHREGVRSALKQLRRERFEALRQYGGRPAVKGAEFMARAPLGNRYRRRRAAQRVCFV